MYCLFLQSVTVLDDISKCFKQIFVEISNIYPQTFQQIISSDIFLEVQGSILVNFVTYEDKHVLRVKAPSPLTTISWVNLANGL